MKALTIHNPYPYLITLPPSDPRYKPVENRQRNFTHRGQMLIHAGKSHDWLTLAIESPGSPNVTRDVTYNIPLSEMQFGVLWAVCNVVECFECGNKKPLPQSILSRWPHFATNPHVIGRFCIVLEDVRKFPEPIPFRGQQFLFDVHDSVVAEQMRKVGL